MDVCICMYMCVCLSVCVFVCVCVCVCVCLPVSVGIDNKLIVMFTQFLPTYSASPGPWFRVSVLVCARASVR